VFVDAYHPEMYEYAAIPCITGVAAEAPAGLLAIAGVHDIAVYSGRGLEYCVLNLSANGVEVTSLKSTVVAGVAREAASNALIEFSLDLLTGGLAGGSSVAVVHTPGSLGMLGSHVPRHWIG